MQFETVELRAKVFETQIFIAHDNNSGSLHATLSQSVAYYAVCSCSFSDSASLSTKSRTLRPKIQATARTLNPRQISLWMSEVDKYGAPAGTAWERRERRVLPPPTPEPLLCVQICEADKVLVKINPA